MTGAGPAEEHGQPPSAGPAAKARPAQLDSALVPKVIKIIARANTWLYRATGGLVGGHWRVGSAFSRSVPICLLTSRGRKSGQPRTTPLLYMADGERIIVVASQGGLPRNPGWYFNVTADPDVTVQIKRRSLRMRARVADAGERADIWPRLVRMYRDFDTYQAWTSREIPVVICEPAGQEHT